jgi:hypothetical protein
MYKYKYKYKYFNECDSSTHLKEVTEKKTIYLKNQDQVTARLLVYFNMRGTCNVEGLPVFAISHGIVAGRNETLTLPHNAHDVEVHIQSGNTDGDIDCVRKNVHLPARYYIRYEKGKTGCYTCGPGEC